MTHLASLARRSWGRLQWGTAAVMLAISGVGFTVLYLDRWVAASWLLPPEFAQFSFASVVLLAAQATQTW